MNNEQKQKANIKYNIALNIGSNTLSNFMLELVVDRISISSKKTLSFCIVWQSFVFALKSSERNINGFGVLVSSSQSPERKEEQSQTKTSAEKNGRM